jgi:hypothetical protein
MRRYTVAASGTNRRNHQHHHDGRKVTPQRAGCNRAAYNDVAYNTKFRVVTTSRSER